MTPEDVGYFFPRGEDIFGINVRGFSSIGKFLAARRVLRAIRAFNLTHMNRGRNAYQASHCYSLADHMLADQRYQIRLPRKLSGRLRGCISKISKDNGGHSCTTTISA